MTPWIAMLIVCAAQAAEPTTDGEPARPVEDAAPTAASAAVVDRAAPAAAAEVLATDEVAATDTLRHRELHVDGLRLHVVEAGPDDGEPLVLLHGFMVSSATFAELQRALATRYRVIALDAPGHGQGDRPRRRLDAAYQAQWTRRALDALGIERCTILGQSMGAATALALAARWPERVERLILVNPAGFEPGFLRRLGMGLFVQDSVYRSGPDWAFWLTARGSTVELGAPGRRDLDEQLALRREPGWAASMASVYRSLRAGGAERDAASLRAPVTLVLGDDDTAYDRGYQERAIAALPGARVERLPACGHNVHHDAPDRLLAIVEAALAGGA